MTRFFALALLLLPAIVLAAGEREKARLESVREQRAALERQLKEKEGSRATVADRLRDTEKDIAASVRKLRALGDESATARADLALRERDLKRLEGQVARRQAQLARLLRYQFQPREADALAILLAGGDPDATGRDRYFLTLLSRAKADLIADLRHDAAETRRLARDVALRGETLADLARRTEKERATLQEHQQERQAMLEKLSGEIRAQRREIATLRQNEQRLGNLIASLAKKSAAARAMRKNVTRKSAGPAVAPPARTARAEPAAASGAFARLRGRLALPVKGTITGRFGARREDGQSIWKGLFIRAADGADVRAVADGVVVFADWLRGYGNLLIVDHDDDFLSVYGNNQTLLADVGHKVVAGKPVATVGASGGQAESGLYFELRHRGQAFDPGKWLGAP